MKTALVLLPVCLLVQLSLPLRGQNNNILDDYIDRAITARYQPGLYTELKEKCVALTQDKSDCDFLFWRLYERLVMDGYTSLDDPFHLTLRPSEAKFTESLTDAQLSVILHNSEVNYLEQLAILHFQDREYRTDTSAHAYRLLRYLLDIPGQRRAVVSEYFTLLHPLLSGDGAVNSTRLYQQRYISDFVRNGQDLGIQNAIARDVTYRPRSEFLRDAFAPDVVYLLAEGWQQLTDIRAQDLRQQLSVNDRVVLINGPCTYCAAEAVRDRRKRIIRQLTKRDFRIIHEQRFGEGEVVTLLHR